VNAWYRLGWIFSRAFFALFGGLRVYGIENVPTSGAFLICANHCSLLDPPALGVCFRHEISYVAKKELHQWPVFGALLRRLSTIPIDRSRPSRQTINAITGVLATGRPLVIFPEGTRSRTGELGEAKTGIGFMARLAAVPILPAFIQNTCRWPWTFKKTSRMAIHFGSPIEAGWIAQISADKAGYRKIANEIMDRIRTQQAGATGADRSADSPTSIKTPPCAVDRSNVCPNGQI
jgi:1-acyl-sn-glycerol-3-phosphate acyltransferase